MLYIINVRVLFNPQMLVYRFLKASSKRGKGHSSWRCIEYFSVSEVTDPLGTIYCTIQSVGLFWPAAPHEKLITPHPLYGWRSTFHVWESVKMYSDRQLDWAVLGRDKRFDGDSEKQPYRSCSAGNGIYCQPTEQKKCKRIPITSWRSCSAEIYLPVSTPVEWYTVILRIKWKGCREAKLQGSLYEQS